jgi:predicted transcriptional regulator
MEIGIHTHPAYRRHGYAEIVCAQLITTCEAQGYRTFWNCGATNVASATLARKLGFHGEQEYALAAWFKSAGRTRTDLIVEAMTRYIDAEMAYIAAVQEGLADIEAGQHRDLDEVTVEWVTRGLLSPIRQNETR